MLPRPMDISFVVAWNCQSVVPPIETPLTAVFNVTNPDEFMIVVTYGPPGSGATCYIPHMAD